MSSQEPEPGLAATASDASGRTREAGMAASATQHAIRVREPSTSRLVLFALAAGALSALAASLVWDSVGGSFSPRGSIVNILGTDQTIITVQGRIEAGVRGGAASAAILGASMGLAMGIAGGLARRAVRAGVAAGLAGACLGAIGGTVAARVLLPAFYSHESPISGDLILPLVTQGGVWCVVGVAGGIAFGLSLGRLDRIIAAGFGGLLGAALGAITFEAIGASAFPNDETDQPVSKTWVTRLLARLLVAVFAAVIAALACRARSSANRARQEGD